MFQIFFSGVPEDYIPGPLPSNIFIKTIYFCLSTGLQNSVKINSISASQVMLKNSSKTLEKKLSMAVDWFWLNSMVVNPDKFQAIATNTYNQLEMQTDLNIKIENKINDSTEATILYGIQ